MAEDTNQDLIMSSIQVGSGKKYTIADKEAREKLAELESTVATKEELQTELATKQDNLSAGEYIRISDTNEISVDLPSGIFTKDTLIGGKDIEIIPEPVEGGIDEYTLACWHLNNDAVDTVNSWKLKCDNSWFNVQIDTNNYQFGAGSGYGFSRTGYYNTGYGDGFSQNISSANLSTHSMITIDSWCSLIEGMNIHFGFLGNSNSYKLGVTIKREYDGTITVTDIYSGLVLCSGITASNFFHISWQFDGSAKTVRASINGSLYPIKQVSLSTEFSLVYFGVYQDEVYGEQLIDELRISNIIRYTSDFTPATQEYHTAEPTGKYIINSTIEPAQVAEQIADNTTTVTDTDGHIMVTGTLAYTADPEQSVVAQKYWVGTKAEYDAVDPKDPNTIYEVLDDEEHALFEVDGTTIEFSDTNELQIAKSVERINRYELHKDWEGNHEGMNGLIENTNVFLEQWGVSTSSEAGEIEFTLHQHFNDLDFSVFITPREQGNFFFYAIPSATNKFRCRIQDTGGYNRAIQFQWRAFGRKRQ